VEFKEIQILFRIVNVIKHCIIVDHHLLTCAINEAKFIYILAWCIALIDLMAIYILTWCIALIDLMAIYILTWCIALIDLMAILTPILS
jgi:hypothetical protein